MKKLSEPAYVCTDSTRRFDSRKTCFTRARIDEDFIGILKTLPKGLPENQEAFASRVGADVPYHGLGNLCDGPVAPSLFPVKDVTRMSEHIKWIARFYGADLVGVCRLNPLWVYSHNPDGSKYDDRFEYAISLGFEMDLDVTMMGNGSGYAPAVRFAYSRMRFTGTMLAEYIRNLGYRAVANGNERVLNVPIAIDAGLGELSRMGLLITHEFGPRLRLASVLTDLPLALDKPVDLGIQDFCEKCKKCARLCPCQAISTGEKTTEAPTISNNPGVYKWPINPEKCYIYWRSNLVKWNSCGRCIQVCPWNKDLEKWYHSLVRWIAERWGWARSLSVWLDDTLKYGKAKQPYGLRWAAGEKYPVDKEWVAQKGRTARISA